jgi:hypothetical protein
MTAYSMYKVRSSGYYFRIQYPKQTRSQNTQRTGIKTSGRRRNACALFFILSGVFSLCPDVPEPLTLLLNLELRT